AAEVAAELAAAATRAEDAGVPRERIVVDPGFGFAKGPEQNFRLLDELATVVGLGYPVAVGPSRKRFLGHATGRPVDDRDRATAVACALAWSGGRGCFGSTTPPSRVRRSRWRVPPRAHGELRSLPLPHPALLAGRRGDRPGRVRDLPLPA